ncbi:glutamic acid-rich protein [Uranotaenia lowii]|uniref:glutamic acid-rich protein n=1 Tax=Uranotaenia lowii TaxID=190385 RepID=UPI00247A0A6C|nr:glutamic acid-rich protein [Uranotaenia lowii]
MVIKVYISGMSGSKEVKKRQQRVTMIMDSKSIPYSIVDITEPGQEEEKDFMQKNSLHNGATVSDQTPRHPLPPQIFSDGEYCGDYDDFDLANEIDNLEVFLKLEAPKENVAPSEVSPSPAVDPHKNGTSTEPAQDQAPAVVVGEQDEAPSKEDDGGDGDEDKENKTEQDEQTIASDDAEIKSAAESTSLEVENPQIEQDTSMKAESDVETKHELNESGNSDSMQLDDDDDEEVEKSPAKEDVVAEVDERPKVETTEKQELIDGKIDEDTTDRKIHQDTLENVDEPFVERSAEIDLETAKDPPLEVVDENILEEQSEEPMLIDEQEIDSAHNTKEVTQKEDEDDSVKSDSESEDEEVDSVKEVLPKTLDYGSVGADTLQVQSSLEIDEDEDDEQEQKATDAAAAGDDSEEQEQRELLEAADAMGQREDAADDQQQQQDDDVEIAEEEEVASKLVDGDEPMQAEQEQEE